MTPRNVHKEMNAKQNQDLKIKINFYKFFFKITFIYLSKIELTYVSIHDSWFDNKGQQSNIVLKVVPRE